MMDKKGLHWREVVLGLLAIAVLLAMVWFIGTYGGHIFRDFFKPRIDEWVTQGEEAAKISADFFKKLNPVTQIVMLERALNKYSECKEGYCDNLVSTYKDLMNKAKDVDDKEQREKLYNELKRRHDQCLIICGSVDDLLKKVKTFEKECEPARADEMLALLKRYENQINKYMEEKMREEIKKEVKELEDEKICSNREDVKDMLGRIKKLLEGKSKELPSEYKDGWSYLINGKYEKAFEEFTKLLEKGVDEDLKLNVLFLVGKSAHLAKKDCGTIERSYGSLVNEKNIKFSFSSELKKVVVFDTPEFLDAQALYDIAMCYYDKKNYRNSLDKIDKLVKKYPEGGHIDKIKLKLIDFCKFTKPVSDTECYEKSSQYGKGLFSCFWVDDVYDSTTDFNYDDMGICVPCILFEKRECGAYNKDGKIVERLITQKDKIFDNVDWEDICQKDICSFAVKGYKCTAYKNECVQVGSKQ